MTTVTVPALAPWITANATTNRHWRHRHGLVKAWRETTALHARAAARTPVRSPFTVDATIHKATGHVWDIDGAVATLKACLDGCRDVGLIQDDDHRHLVALTIRAGAPDKTHPRVELTITEEEP